MKREMRGPEREELVRRTVLKKLGPAKSQVDKNCRKQESKLRVRDIE